MIRRHAVLRSSLLSALALTGACASDKPTGPVVSSYLHGTASNHQIGIVVNSTGHAVTLFQLGAPTNTKQVALGASNAITPVGLSVRGESAIVPLGDASSVALIDLNTLTITRFFLFAAGNTTGQAFVDDTTVFADNSDSAYVGRFTTGQASDTIRDTVHVAPSPTDIEVSGSRVLVISANLNASFLPNGNGIVTAIDAHSLTVLDTVSTGGTNSTAGAIGPDGNLYVVNTGDFVNPGSMTVINPATLAVIQTVPNVGVGPGAIAIDSRGLAYISSFSGGTVIWNINTQAFVRGPNNPLCAPISGGGCRGAFDARPDSAGNVYQVFFGSPSQNLNPYVFVYHAGTYALTDSISVGPGPSALRIAEF
jgi:YVTN family beta-propeller protein